MNTNLQEQVKQIFEVDNKMSRLASKVWFYKFGCWDLGKEIEELDKFKWGYFGEEALKRAGVTCVYGLSNYKEICDLIYKKFVPLWEKIKNNIRSAENSRRTIETGAYLYYHYEGWIIRYGKEHQPPPQK